MMQEGASCCFSELPEDCFVAIVYVFEFKCITFAMDRAGSFNEYGVSAEVSMCLFFRR